MTHVSIQSAAAPTGVDSGFPGRLLTDAELDAVSGGFSAYERSLTTAVSFAGLAAASLVSAPFVAGAFALGSITASGIAIFSSLTSR
jgi:hypothetical protein